MHKLLTAVRAALGLRLVDLLMPRQLFLGMEHLVAEADVVLHLLLDVQVVPVPVLYQVRVSAECFVTQVALYRSLARVDVFVLVVLLLGEERLLAHFALVVLDPEVPLVVKCQVLRAVEVLSAQPALERVHPQVCIVLELIR